MTLDDYILNRLLKADRTSYVDGAGTTHYIATEDACSRLSRSHTLPSTSETFSNFPMGDMDIESAMVEFYRNSLKAGQPRTADAIICKESLIVPGHLERICWEHDGWFLFNKMDGFLTANWWNIYGYLPPTV